MDRTFSFWDLFTSKTQISQPHAMYMPLHIIYIAYVISMLFSAGIRLAGATSDVHLMDVRSGKWERANTQGEPPSPRAAHAAAAVGSMVVVQVSSSAMALDQ
jgi:hypothetical protein